MDDSTLNLGKVVTFFMLTLGPFSVIRPFAVLTSAMDTTTRAKIAASATVVSTLSVLIAATVGVSFLTRWNISVESLLVAAGILLFVYSLNAIRGQYVRASDSDARAAAAAREPLGVMPAAFQMAFPYVVSPYGIAVVVLIMAVGSSELGNTPIYAVLLAIMLLNGVTMLASNWLVRSVVFVPLLSMVSSVLIVLQAALGVEAVLTGLKGFGIAGN